MVPLSSLPHLKTEYGEAVPEGDGDEK